MADGWGLVALAMGSTILLWVMGILLILSKRKAKGAAKNAQGTSEKAQDTCVAEEENEGETLSETLSISVV